MTKRLVVIIAMAFLLRISFVGSFPALYADEAAFGYNAYHLLETGRDEFGRFWPMGFESFGDWKPPMQGWLAIPFIKILGLNELAVRLPSVILGTATVVVIYFLAQEVFKRTVLEYSRTVLSAISALLLSISPWHILMSRMSMLVAIEVFFVSLGVLGLLKGLNNARWWIISAISFSGAVYSYYGSRVTVPLILLSFFLIFRREVATHSRSVFTACLAGVIFLSPLLVAAIRNPLVLTGRARTTSIFFNDNIRLQLWDSRTKAGLAHIPPVVTRFFDNKLYYYSTDIIRRYTQHFSPSFLFFQGDHQAPFRTSGLGVVHLLDLPFLLIGLLAMRKSMTKKHSVEQVIEDSLGPFSLFSPEDFTAEGPEDFTVEGTESSGHSGSEKPSGRSDSEESSDSKSSKRRTSDSRRDDHGTLFLCLYLLVAPFVASLTFLTPAANRSFNLMIPWTIVTAIGIVTTFRHLVNSQRFLGVVIAFAYTASLTLFLWRYAIATPQDYPRNWQMGKKELVQKAKPLLSSVNTVISTDHGGPAYIFFAFYLPITPEEFHRTVVQNQEFDELGWEHVDRVLNITIPRNFTWKIAPIDQSAVYIGFENELPHDKIDTLGRVYYPNGGVAYEIGTLKYWVTEN